MSALANIHFQDTAAQTWLTPREAAMMMDKAIMELKSIYYYCLVDNKTARDQGVDGCARLLDSLSMSIDTDDHNQVAKNLKNLLHYLALAVRDIKKSSSAKAAQELLGLLEPIRNGLLQG
jgi:flagellin-specific chaperone FliS